MQLALVYDAAHAGNVEWEDELKWIRRAVEVVGHKEVAFKLDVAPSHLTDALLERERKDVKACWVPILLRLVPEEMRAEYLRIVAASLGYDAPKRSKPKTAEQKNRERHEWLLKHAPAMLDLMEKDLGT